MPSEELVYGGVCPVCDEEFVDAGTLMDEYEGESLDVKMCIVEGPDGGEGSSIIHLPEGLDAN